MNNFGKNLALWIIIILLLVALFNLFQSQTTRGPQASLPFSDFLSDVNRDQVADVTIQGTTSAAISPTDAPSRPTRRTTPTWSAG